MRKTIAIVLAATATLVTTAVPAAARDSGAFAPITAVYRPATNDYCIRSGWGIAMQAANRLIRRGDCHTEAGWQVRKIQLNSADVALAKRGADIQVAAR